ncbi:MAG: M1 family aminopeptidase [Brumimicrobium sp.]
MKKIKFLIPIFVFCFSGFGFGQTNSELANMRSDTIDVLNYNIKIDFTEMDFKKISASTTIHFKSKMDNVEGISLDLLRLQVDSVISNNIPLAFSYNDTLLRAYFDVPLSTDEINEITVFYKGVPVKDQSTFGGFYFQGDYAYNIGVGMNANPHNYGRVWYPCFDNFVERATYDIEIISPEGKTGFSNGFIVDESVGVNNESIIKWRINEEIPSYLASVGVAPYARVEQTYISNLDGQEIPILLVAKPSDTTKMKNSFIHLKEAMDIYQNAYGPYRWNKIGYTVVPFSGGAMEHATSIMYPVFAVNGNLNYEFLMAHELSHHWWGNLVTCRTPEDMWINEGLASYSESLFYEHRFDYDRYIDDLKNKHISVLKTAHYNDGDFLPLSGVPHHATYGTHTYTKGATMTHNLRTHMGDNDFFDGLKAIQNEFAFKDIDAYDFRDALTNHTGFDADDFFEGYVLNPGFNGFEIDSFVVKPSGDLYEVKVYIQQKLFEAPNLFNNVPVQITFVKEDWSDESEVYTFSGEHNSISTTLNFHPKMVYLNKDHGLLNAVTAQNMVVYNYGMRLFDYAYFKLKYNQENDSSFVRIEHCRIPPDPYIDSSFIDNVIISPDRYWKVDGLFSNGFTGTGEINYDGRTTLPDGFLDNKLLQDYNGVLFHEDSIILLYRPNQHEKWLEHIDYELKTGSNKTDKAGVIIINQLLKGEYTLGVKQSTLNLEKEKDLSEIKIYPNPVNNKLFIESEKHNLDRIVIINVNGAIVYEGKFDINDNQIDVSHLATGHYSVALYYKDSMVKSTKFIKK